MIKEAESMDRLVSLYVIDTEYNTTLKVITLKEFYDLCKGA